MKVAIYCRLSEEDRNKHNKNDDSNSIINQKSMLLQYSLDQKWELYDIYSDDDYTGADRNRPQFKRLLADAEARKFDIILCKTQSRFTRELELVEKYIHGLFPAWGIRFVSIVDNADTANKGNKKSRQINGLVNEWYLEDMSDNIRSVLTSRRENGFHIGAFAPYGYRKDPNQKGHLLIDPDAAAIVKEIFSLFADGFGKSAIARLLNDRQVPNPSEYKRLKGLRYKQATRNVGKLWSYASIQEILTNEVYIGNLVQGKSGSISYKTKEIRARPQAEWIRVEHTHEPIIDDELWNRVQSKVSTHFKPFRNSGKIHPFSGKIKCMYCESSVSMHKSHGLNYLQCNTRQISKKACYGAFIPVRELEQIVLQELRVFTKELLDRDELEREVSYPGELNDRKKRIIQEKESYEKRKEDYAAAIKELYMDKLRGVITEQNYLEMRKEFIEGKERMETLVVECQNRLNEMDVRMAAKDNRFEMIRSYLTLCELTRSMSEALIDHIEIGKRNKETGNVPVSIFWNF